MVAAACGGAETNTNTGNANAPKANANTNALPPANNALEPTKAPEVATTNEAPTFGPVINAYYDALRKKDAAGVRKLMEKEFLKSIEEDMKSEKKTDIIAVLMEGEKLPEGKMEARNEQINGDKGTAQIKGGVYSTWTPFVFIKEDGVWKVSNQVSSPGAK